MCPLVKGSHTDCIGPLALVLASHPVRTLPDLTHASFPPPASWHYFRGSPKAAAADVVSLDYLNCINFASHALLRPGQSPPASTPASHPPCGHARAPPPAQRACNKKDAAGLAALASHLLLPGQDVEIHLITPLPPSPPIRDQPAWSHFISSHHPLLPPPLQPPSQIKLATQAPASSDSLERLPFPVCPPPGLA